MTLTCRRVVATMSLAMTFSLASCGVPQTQVDASDIVSIYEDDEVELDKNALQDAVNLLAEDQERYEPNSDMTAYIISVHNAVELSSKDGCTQEDLDAALEDVARLREIMVDPTLKMECEELPPFDDMVAEPDKYVGRVFRVSGRVTTISGGGTGYKGEKANADWFIYVFWDETETIGQVASVRVPHNRYESAHKHFDGRCIFEGIDDKGIPQFLTYSYEAR